MELLEYIEERQEMIDAAMKDFIHTRFDNEVMEMIAYIATGGKRFRGILALLTCEGAGGTAEDAMVAACAIELAHAASLSKDDYMDGDSRRRGRPAAWVKYGARLAMLTPDVILPHAMDFVSEYGLRALHSVNWAWGKLALGQFLDYPRAGFLPLGPNEYERIISLKTAPLFQVACTLGVRASRRDWFLSVAEQFGYNTGLAFQVYDDAADLGEHMGQSWESISGDKSLPRSVQALKVRVGGGGTITEADKTATLALAEGYLERAIEAANAFPETPVKPLLLMLPNFCCEAMLVEVKQNISVPEEAANASRLYGVAL